ncbi:Holliday junction branch migration protein RuvA [Amphibiibacter pelophylacis]|uniref:Holliday junction branch migration protein RuvA n=1 Tax=Amphibiibacter pelophylacis TaxID=1799477 RepID=A0ACC6P2E1_9BURK
MIARLRGTLLEKSPPAVVLDVGGVGYEVDVPMSTFFSLPAVGQATELLIHYAVREGAHELFGFLTATERATFRELLRISGVGPRLALAVLSGLGVDELAAAVAAQDARRLVKVPGVGKKTAERLLLELKGRLGAVATGTGALLAAPQEAPSWPPGLDDVYQALIALGYAEKDARGAVRQLPEGTPVSEGIRLALGRLT